MKICDLTQSYAETGGGVRTYLHAKRAWLRERSPHEHVLIVPGAGDIRIREGRSTTYHVASPPVPGSSAYRLLLRSDKVLRILAAERPDVVEVHCTYNLPWTALWHRRRHPCAVVGFCMTDLGQAYVEPALRRVLGRRIGTAGRRVAEGYTTALYGRCNATVSISSAMADDLRGRGVRNVRHVPLGVDADRFHPGRRDPDVRRRLGAGEDDLLLVYAGRLDTEKRPDRVMDAFERLPPDFPAVLVLAGAGPLAPGLARRAERRGGARVIPFVQDRDELATLLASADVYVSGMAHETFGLSVLEAQACGLPVVGLRSGAMTERVAEGETGLLVEPDDAEAMASAIARTPRDELRRMGREARARVESTFSWSATFTRLLALYEELLDGRVTAGGGAGGERRRIGAA